MSTELTTEELYALEHRHDFKLKAMARSTISSRFLIPIAPACLTTASQICCEPAIEAVWETVARFPAWPRPPLTIRTGLTAAACRREREGLAVSCCS